MMSDTKSEKDKTDSPKKPEQAKVTPPSRGKTFDGRGVEKSKG